MKFGSHFAFFMGSVTGFAIIIVHSSISSFLLSMIISTFVYIFISIVVDYLVEDNSHEEGKGGNL